MHMAERTLQCNRSISIRIFRPHVPTPIIRAYSLIEKPARARDIRDPRVLVVDRDVYERLRKWQEAEDQEGKETHKCGEHVGGCDITKTLSSLFLRLRSIEKHRITHSSQCLPLAFKCHQTRVSQKGRLVLRVKLSIIPCPRMIHWKHLYAGSL